MPAMNICTIIAKNYVAHARVLAQSYMEHHPEGTCHVLAIDDTEGYIDASLEPFELVTPANLGIDDYEHMAAIYDVLELSTAVKPWLLRHLLYERGLERVAYLDPDIRLYDILDEIAWLPAYHGTLRRRRGPPPPARDRLQTGEAVTLSARP